METTALNIKTITQTLAKSAQRFKQIREELGITQSAFAERLGIKNTTADIERGKVKISGRIVTQLLKDYQINPLWLYGDSKQKHLHPQSQDVAPKIITVNDQGLENILLVNTKAAAGYADNIQEPEYYEELPAFSVPLPAYHNTSFRGFQVEGDSMMPAIKPDDWILAKAIANVDELKNGKVYVIVEEESVRVKKVQKNTNSLTLISINNEYPAVEIPLHEVKEIWEFYSKLSTAMDTQPNNDLLKDIKTDLEEIKSRL